VSVLVSRTNQSLLQAKVRENSLQGWYYVKSLGWLCPATFSFCISRHQYWHFVSFRPETRDVAARVSGRKSVQSTELDIAKGSFCNLCALAGRLPSADESQQGRNSCPLLRSCFIGSCHVGVSKRFSRSISLAVYWPSIVFAYFFGLIRSLVDPTLVRFIVCGPIQFMLLIKVPALFGVRPALKTATWKSTLNLFWN